MIKWVLMLVMYYPYNGKQIISLHKTREECIIQKAIQEKKTPYVIFECVSEEKMFE